MTTEARTIITRRPFWSANFPHKGATSPLAKALTATESPAKISTALPLTPSFSTYKGINGITSEILAAVKNVPNQAINKLRFQLIFIIALPSRIDVNWIDAPTRIYHY